MAPKQPQSENEVRLAAQNILLRRALCTAIDFYEGTIHALTGNSGDPRADLDNSELTALRQAQENLAQAEELLAKGKVQP